jgi:hypothetical protein
MWPGRDSTRILLRLTIVRSQLRRLHNNLVRCWPRVVQVGSTSCWLYAREAHEIEIAIADNIRSRRNRISSGFAFVVFIRVTRSYLVNATGKPTDNGGYSFVGLKKCAAVARRAAFAPYQMRVTLPLYVEPPAL